MKKPLLYTKVSHTVYSFYSVLHPPFNQYFNMILHFVVKDNLSLKYLITQVHDDFKSDFNAFCLNIMLYASLCHTRSEILQNVGHLKKLYIKFLSEVKTEDFVQGTKALGN